MFLTKLIILTIVEAMILNESNAERIKIEINSQSEVDEIAKVKISEDEVRTETRDVYEILDGISNVVRDLEGPGEHHTKRVKKENTLTGIEFNPVERSAGDNQLPRPEANPYLAFLCFAYVNKDGYLVSNACSGFLLTLEWVLTSAHCVYTPTSLKYTMIVAGATRLEMRKPYQKDVINFTVSAIGEYQALPSSKLLAHDLYDPKAATSVNMHYDIMLVRTEGKFNLTKFVSTIPLSVNPWEHQGYKGCAAAGFRSADGDRFYRQISGKVKVKKPCDCSWTFKALVKRYSCAKHSKENEVGFSDGGLLCEERIWAMGPKKIPLDPLNFCLPVTKTENNTIYAFVEMCVFLEWINENVGLFNKTEISKQCLNFTETPDELEKMVESVMPKLLENACGPLDHSSSLYLLNITLMLFLLVVN